VYSGQPFIVGRDGRDFAPFVPPSPLPGSQIVENFQVAGREGNVLTVTMPYMAAEPRAAGFAGEVWTRKGSQLLQLTNFARTDTHGGALSRDGGRVVFQASTNRLGTNPMNNCQLFSMPRLGGTIRQLTRFDPPMPSLDGCNRNAPPPACLIGGVQVDPVTDSIVFGWTCDPFGLNPISFQTFAMRQDGSGLRQVTNYAGLRDEPDGGLSVELPGPTVYSARDQSAGRGRKTNPK
jgi:hypothetical protein